MSSKARWLVALVSRREVSPAGSHLHACAAAWAHWTGGLVTFDPSCDRRSRQIIVVPPALGRAVGEPPESSRRSTQVVKRVRRVVEPGDAPRSTSTASCVAVQANLGGQGTLVLL
jgi:hypothetical protein